MELERPETAASAPETRVQSRPWVLFVWSLQVLSVATWVFTDYSAFLPHPKGRSVLGVVGKVG